MVFNPETNHCPLFNLTNFCSTWICHEITKCNRKQPASAAAFYFEKCLQQFRWIYYNSFWKCLSVEYLITYILKGFRWYCRWAKYSSYKRWIIDKLGAGGLSSSQNCKTLPFPTISNSNSNSIIFIMKGGGHHPEIHNLKRNSMSLW